jgi:hypothetical protein
MSIISVIPSIGFLAADHFLRGVMPRSARRTSAERSFCCSLGTFNEASTARASSMRFAAALRFPVGALATEEDLIDQAIKLLLLRKGHPNPSPERDEG